MQANHMSRSGQFNFRRKITGNLFASQSYVYMSISGQCSSIWIISIKQFQTWDFQQCGILTWIDSGESVQPIYA